MIYNDLFFFYYCSRFHIKIMDPSDPDDSSNKTILQEREFRALQDTDEKEYNEEENNDSDVQS